MPSTEKAENEEKHRPQASRSMGTLRKLSPIFAFIVPLAILYYLYPISFEGDPTWGGSWQGRFFYLFFVWIVSLVTILKWEKLASKVNKLRSTRTILFILSLALPTVYVITANCFGLNQFIATLAQENNVFHAGLIPLALEYFVFASLFALMVTVANGTKNTMSLLISSIFLGVIGIAYAIDDVYPGGSFTPFQILVAPTATLAKNILSFMGYTATMTFTNTSQLGSMPTLLAQDPVNPSKIAVFSIAWPCAGVESLLIFTVTTIVFLSITAASFRRKAVYFAIGAIVTYFINILRIVSIFVIAVNSGDWMRFHNIYGPLYSIAWVTVYPLIMIASEFYLRKLR